VVSGLWFLVGGGMATLKRFEDIEAWQVARKLTREVYALSGKGRFAKDFGLQVQIRRAAVSFMSNIAEGFERGGSAEFSHFLSIAKGSTGEIEAQLYVAFDQGYVNREQFEATKDIAVSTKKLIAGFMNYLKRSTIKGQKFK
jgi:four helix bundle protein